jgi:hypothetical protein
LNLRDYKEKLNEADSIQKKDNEINNILFKVMDRGPIDIGFGTRNLIIVVEELAELIEVISIICQNEKYRENHNNIPSDTMYHLLEEITDVYLAMHYAIRIFELYDVYNAQDFTTTIKKEEDVIHTLTSMQIQATKYLRGKWKLETITQYLINTNIKMVLKACNWLLKEYNFSEDLFNKSVNVKLERLGDSVYK